jgi:adenylate kinase family enzyme
MDRILIYGAASTGKSFFARRVSLESGYPCFHLDRLIKEPNDIFRACKLASWIIEGSHGDLIQQCLPRTTLLVYVDLDVAGPVDRKADKLEDPFSSLYHSKIFDEYPKDKLRIISQNQLKAWSIQSVLKQYSF